MQYVKNTNTGMIYKHALKAYTSAKELQATVAALEDYKDYGDEHSNMIHFATCAKLTAEAAYHIACFNRHRDDLINWEREEARRCEESAREAEKKRLAEEARISATLRECPCCCGTCRP